ncbi:hypothetical protein [Sphingomicrobium flavum]|uniref:hypothetical protein n=1 Tax=Sphingomicrobium flavum TaxID=1229164 RepID=UPI0021ADD0A1|nr:hypothetical protein [Sphingomicrobium flavum]
MRLFISILCVTLVNATPAKACTQTFTFQEMTQADFVAFQEAGERQYDAAQFLGFYESLSAPEEYSNSNPTPQPGKLRLLHAVKGKPPELIEIPWKMCQSFDYGQTTLHLLSDNGTFNAAHALHLGAVGKGDWTRFSPYIQRISPIAPSLGPFQEEMYRGFLERGPIPPPPIRK